MARRKQPPELPSGKPQHSGVSDQKADPFVGQRDSRGRFLDGNKGGPGIEKGTRLGGRALIVKLLDELLADPERLAALKLKWGELFDRNPAAFIKRVVLDFMPKQQNITLETPERLPIRIEFPGDDEQQGDEPPEGEDAWPGDESAET